LSNFRLFIAHLEGTEPQRMTKAPVRCTVLRMIVG